MSVAKKELAPLPIPSSCKTLNLYSEEGFLRVEPAKRNSTFFQINAWISSPTQNRANSFLKNLHIQNASSEPGSFAPRLLARGMGTQQIPFLPTFLGFDGIASCKPWLRLKLGTIGGICSSEGYQAESIQAYAAHGTLRLGAAKSKILFRTNSGLVTISGPFRSVQGKTDSGPIFIHISPLCQSLDIQSQSGNLILVVHPGVKARIDFESEQGNVIGKIPYGDQRIGPSVSSRRPLGVRHLLLTIPPDFKPGVGANDNPGIRIRFRTREGALILQAPIEKKRTIPPR